MIVRPTGEELYVRFIWWSIIGGAVVYPGGMLRVLEHPPKPSEAYE